MATKTARKVSKAEAKVRGKVSKPETKVRNAKVSKATAKPETKVRGKAKATPQPRATAGPGKGSGIQLADNMRIILKRRDNPKRPGTASYERFNLYLTKKPKTVAEALKAGITRADLRWDAARDFIELH